MKIRINLLYLKRIIHLQSIYLYYLTIAMLGRSLLKFKQNKCKQHPDENYSLICLETECEDRGIICAECQIIKHDDHLVKPLTLALKEISDDLQPMPHLLQTMAKIDILYAKFYTLLGRLGRNIKTIEEELNRFFRQIHDRIKNYKAACSKILDQATLNVQFNTLIKKYKFYSRGEGDRETTNFECFLKEILEYIGDRSNQFEEFIKKKAENRQILQILAPFEMQTKFQYTFSQDFKQTNITISPDNLTATQLNNYSTNFALVVPILDGKKPLRTKRTIKFQINKLSSWLSLGVAYHSFAKKANYYFNTGSTGHGGFLISYNGYSWHHSDSSLNSNCVAFNFAQGDIIAITINPSTSKLLFEKQNQSSSFELAYEKINGQQLYFCVSLSSHQESVSIVK